jgi:uncharacterized membrane protein
MIFEKLPKISFRDFVICYIAALVLTLIAGHAILYYGNWLILPVYSVIIAGLVICGIAFIITRQKNREREER